ncbi:hypothetical protein ACEWY4_003336 [Coilia grayii]|uniref:C2 NT-type domain-containing protein n=1 Tax=Coilia grayii TaxID=363190 RepID=A0ABD1KQY4_9TELE
MDHGRLASALLQANAFMRKQLCTHRFSVSLFLAELANVPQVTGWLFCKVRLLDGSFMEETESNEVFHNTVQWRKEFVFECRATVNGSTGVLGNCICRISVRKDRKGGKSFIKVGYVDLNLIEFVGSGYVTRHCLLEGYRGKHSKLDNSLLKVIKKIFMLAINFTSCYKNDKIPVDSRLEGSTQFPQIQVRLQVQLPASPPECQPTGVPVEFLRDQPQVSSGPVEETLGQDQWANEEQERALEAEHLVRLVDTRVDAWDVVENLCRERLGSHLELTLPMNDAGLALYVSEDGSTTLGVSPQENRYNIKMYCWVDNICEL